MILQVPPLNINIEHYIEGLVQFLFPSQGIHVWYIFGLPPTQ